MKYIKKFESITQDIKRGEILIDIADSYSSVYLVLENVLKNQRKIHTYIIGYYKNEQFYLLDNGIFDAYKRYNIRIANEIEKLDIVKNIYSRIENNYFCHMLKNIKKETNIDLLKTPEYIKYLDEIEMKKNIKKYNL